MDMAGSNGLGCLYAMTHSEYLLNRGVAGKQRAADNRFISAKSSVAEKMRALHRRIRLVFDCLRMAKTSARIPALVSGQNKFTVISLSRPVDTMGRQGSLGRSLAHQLRSAGGCGRARAAGAPRPKSCAPNAKPSPRGGSRPTARSSWRAWSRWLYQCAMATVWCAQRLQCMRPLRD